jgi:hypothetical protein
VGVPPNAGDADGGGAGGVRAGPEPLVTGVMLFKDDWLPSDGADGMSAGALVVVATGFAAGGVYGIEYRESVLPKPACPPVAVPPEEGENIEGLVGVDGVEIPVEEGAKVVELVGLPSDDGVVVRLPNALESKADGAELLRPLAVDGV